MASQESALALFEQFRPKFRGIKWQPAGFRLGEPTARFAFYPDTKEGYSYYDYPSLDIQEYGLTFDFKYNPAKQEDPVAQMLMACWNKILTGPFAGSQFYADPAEGAIEKAFRAFTENRFHGDIPIVFSHTGDPIRGLHLIRNMTAKWWTFFIPESPERAAISAALELEREQRQKQLAELPF